MYILSLLTVKTNTVEIVEVFREHVSAVNHLHECICKTLQQDETLESQIIETDRVEVYQRLRGWISSNKELVQVFQICNHDSELSSTSC